MMPVLRQTLRLRFLAAVLVVSVGAPGCGGSSKVAGSASSVAQVGATPIPRAMFDHWMAITVALRSLPAPGQATVRRTAPDPPSFERCVASRRSANPKTKFTTEQLKAACEHQYEELKPVVLRFLISAYWRHGEAQEQAIVVTDAEAERQLTIRVKRQYPTPGAFQRFLASSDQTMADVLFATQSQIIGKKLEQQVAAGHPDRKARQIALAAFAHAYDQKWKGRTTCSAGFVVPQCKHQN
jgi:hypothetical protein